MDKHSFYDVFSYSDNLDPGKKARIEHSLSFQESKADLSGLTCLSAAELDKRRNDSVEKERAIFQKLCAAFSEWEQQAGQTLLLDKAKEYVRTPEVSHASNRWVKQDGDSWEISNRVYKMWYKIYEETKWSQALQKSIPCAWSVTWSVDLNLPRQPNGYNYSVQIAGQENKRYPSPDAAARYIQGRADTYAELFTELSPPIPPGRKHLFSVNGQLLPGYTLQPPMEPNQDTVKDLLSFLEDTDLSAGEVPKVPAEQPRTPTVKQTPAKKKHHSMVR